MQGKEAVTRSKSAGSCSAVKLLTSLRTKCPKPKRARYISALPGAMSLANLHVQPSGSIASRTKPMPAKNSANAAMPTRSPTARQRHVALATLSRH